VVNGLVFDCDGVLSDTERFGHLPAFNQTFQEFGLPIRWTEEEYGGRLQIGGGKERLASLLTPDFIRDAGLPTDTDELAAELQRWHRRKTEIYVGMVADGKLPPRPGIRRLVADAQDHGWRLAVASTSAEPSVRAILDHAVGPDRAARFDAILAGDCVPAKKPAPDIYQLAIERLGVPAQDTLVIEDSRNGLLAATAAGLRCVVTVNGYTANENSSEAVLVVSSLGDPDAEPIRVIANRGGSRPGSYVTLSDLDACLHGRTNDAASSTVGTAGPPATSGRS
jgi:HAD superfamily hydrolase (TIGR01509 family)